MAAPEPDPDRHLKRLQEVFGVSGRIQNLAVRRRKEVVVVSKEEKDREMMARSKEMRTKRLSGISPTHRYVLELVAGHFDVDTDIISDGMCDEERHCELLNLFVCRNGPMGVAFFYDEFPYPGIGGRGKFIVFSSFD